MILKLLDYSKCIGECNYLQIHEKSGKLFISISKRIIYTQLLQQSNSAIILSFRLTRKKNYSGLLMRLGCLFPEKQKRLKNFSLAERNTLRSKYSITNFNSN